MIFTCYIVEDDPDSLELIKGYIEQTPILKLIGASINPLEALDVLTGVTAPDLTFLDIDMRPLTGLELAGMVNLYTSVIFTTAFPEYALQAFDNEAFDFLLKPINYERFLKSIQRAKRKIKRKAVDNASNEGFFTIKSEIKGRMIKVRFDEVIYIEGAVNYIQIFTTEGKHMTYLTMREIERHLPSDIFARIHRSFIINVSFVKIIERAQVRMQSGESLIMGDHYKQKFLNLMDQHLVKSKRGGQ
ncbi:LytTR family DNA-binding domain-containing protein [Mucilaginibacter sabulilitoris]|uniref:LytTR family DNA-binding domain-containing protein n=1 Tax=Mucilaginibacter sabulilitoris TaxID=1173583 RepID=A0ABZ0TPJ4_9SPHI|nr:LytTR family DNA-binding domain-containing protein [Mucilaginibacter sabulilitoris]WPU94794.1 LytTR family DNA-binding domain-containing protein [Mucilaginibacter sabulilitoris]